MNLNALVGAVKESVTVQLADRVRELRSSGETIIALQTGDPNFAPAECVTKAVADSISNGETHYAQSAGKPELKSAILAHETRLGRSVESTDNILVTAGGVHAIYCLLRTLTDPTDEVIIPDISWMPYRSVTTMCGAKPVFASCIKENGFFPDVNEVRGMITPKTKAIIINSPNNPTGQIASKNYLESLLQLTQEFPHVCIISDEVYSELILDGEFTSALSFPQFYENVFVVNSFSKTFAMTGFRLGYVMGPSAAITEVKKLVQYSLTNVAPFVQSAGVAALTQPDSGEWTQTMLSAYKQRASLAMSLASDLEDVGISAITPKGGFYLFLDIRKLGVSTDNFCRRLLDEQKVAIAPATAYGTGGEGFVRLSLASTEEDIKAGIEGIIKLASSLGK